MCAADINCSLDICEHSCQTGSGCLCRSGYKLLADWSSCLGNDYTLSLRCYFTTGYNINSLEPLNTSVKATNSTALQASWESPSLRYLNVSLLGYEGSCTATYGNNHYVYYNFSITTTVYLTGLLPFTFYTCCIHAVSNMGNGPLACGPIVQTLESSKCTHKFKLQLLTPILLQFHLMPQIMSEYKQIAQQL